MMDSPSQSHPIRGQWGLAALRPPPLSRNSRHSGLICRNSPLLHRGRFLMALTLPGGQGWALSTWMGFLEDRNRLGKPHQGWERGNDSAPWWDWDNMVGLGEAQNLGLSTCSFLPFSLHLHLSSPPSCFIPPWISLS